MQEERKTTETKAPRPAGGGMGHGMPGMVDKPKDFKKTFAKLKDFLKPYFLPLLLVVLFAIGSTVFGITGPKILGNVTTKIFEGLLSKISGGPGIDFSGIQRTLLILLAVYVFSSILGFIQSYIVRSEEHTSEL